MRPRNLYVLLFMHNVNGDQPTKWESPCKCGVVASALTLWQMVMGSDCRVYESPPSSLHVVAAFENAGDSLRGVC